MRFLANILIGGLLFCTVSSCSDSHSHFAGAEVTRVTVAGSTFDIRLRGNLAEAARINPQYAPRLGPLQAQAAAAMARVSGCDVKGVLGDQALMTGVLDCPDQEL
ncbi:hypothetical protein [Pseudophaeobacter sp.]|uniref:hypothetical protein n=1 Tax=Pseudophaeobacter sp. TaxID=1971739 RepID=UPI00329A1314